MNQLQFHGVRSIALSLARSLALVLCACFVAGCDNASTARGPVTAEQPLRIVTTIRPIELIARDVLLPAVGDVVDISLLMPPDASPHGFEPTPGQMAHLRTADIIILNGLGLDDWAVRNVPATTLVLRFADVLGDEADHHHHDHDHAECNHDHGPIDEHLWLDVELVNAFAAKCAAEIGKRLTVGDNRDVHASLQASLAVFHEAAREIDLAFAAALSAHHGRRIVTHHNVFSRLTNRYSLGEPVVLRPVEMLEPTPGDIRRAIDTIRSDGLTFILIEPQFSPVAADRIREETDVRLISVDPLGGGSTSWSAFMQQVLDALTQGLAR